MGCGASKNPDLLVAAQPKAEEKDKSSLAPAAAAALPERQSSSQIASEKKIDDAMVDVAVSKTGDGTSSDAAPVADDTKPKPADGLSKLPSQKTLTVMVIAEPQSQEQEAASEPERPASGEPKLPPIVAPENPARAAFHARHFATSPDDLPPSPVAFRSMRSLNRSFGVRRRTSDQGVISLQQPEQQQQQESATLEAEPAKSGGDWPFSEDESDGPDPLREQFEMTKESNPLVIVGRQSRGTGILSRRASEKASKSHKRLAVGFVIESEGDGATAERPSSGRASSGSVGKGDDASAQADRVAGFSDGEMEAERAAPAAS